MIEIDDSRLNLSAAVEELWALHHRYVARSGNAAGSEDDLRFLALAVGGEAGEVLELALRLVVALLSIQNQVKKRWRGFGDEDRSHLVEEMGDAFVYWALLARAVGIDVGEVPTLAIAKARRKIEELEAR